MSVSECAKSLEINFKNIILASEPNQQGTTGYLRFSIADDAHEDLQLTSEELMRSLFNTTVTDALGSGLESQQIANCYQAPRYVKFHV